MRLLFHVNLIRYTNLRPCLNVFYNVHPLERCLLCSVSAHALHISFIWWWLPAPLAARAHSSFFSNCSDCRITSILVCCCLDTDAINQYASFNTVSLHCFQNSVAHIYYSLEDPARRRFSNAVYVMKSDAYEFWFNSPQRSSQSFYLYRQYKKTQSKGNTKV